MVSVGLVLAQSDGDGADAFEVDCAFDVEFNISYVHLRLDLSLERRVCDTSIRDVLGLSTNRV